MEELLIIFQNWWNFLHQHSSSCKHVKVSLYVRIYTDVKQWIEVPITNLPEEKGNDKIDRPKSYKKPENSEMILGISRKE